MNYFGKPLVVAAMFSYTPIAYAQTGAEKLSFAGVCWTAAQMGNAATGGNGFSNIADVAWATRRNDADVSAFETASSNFAAAAERMNDEQYRNALMAALLICVQTYGLQN